jgi:hypothetical protein
MPDPDGLDATWSNVWWLFRRTLSCAIRGHRGVEFFPHWEGDKHWRCCRRCGRSWKLQEAAADERR